MRFSRNSIAAAATIAALGVLAAVALAGGETNTTTAPAPTAETDPPPQVRTEVVRRTVHRNAGAQTASSDDDGTADQGPGDAPRTPVAPVATATGHDVGDDHGRHHGGDDDHDNSGPGSSSSGHGGGDDDSSGHGGGDDDSSGHGGHGGDD